MSTELSCTAIRLADGRELVYYDAAPGAERGAIDARDLDPVAVRAEVRRDPLLDEPVMLASHRQGRTHLPPSDACPLCPSRPGHATEIPAADYEVVVFENRFPSLAAPGRCEVVCFTSDHGASFADLTVERARLVIDTWADRTAALSARPGVEQVFVFENRGEAIGVTLHHPHGQVYAYPFLPPRTARMLEVARRYHAATGGTLAAEVLATERSGPRVVVAGDAWTAYVPHAARWPVEVHLAPHRAVPDLANLDDAERDELARLYLDLLGRLDRIHGMPIPYVAAWHQAPVHSGRELLRLHLQLVSIQRAADRLKYFAGSEAAMGAFINDLVPEDTARRLRDA
jgi:UDPglucose--hexose-1-phosphate uridylyltransferase